MSEDELIKMVKKLVRTYLEIRKTVEDVENEIVDTLVRPLKEISRKYTMRRLLNEILEDIHIED